MSNKIEHIKHLNEPAYFSEQVINAERFYRNPTNISDRGVYVIGGGRERCGPGYEITRPTFPFFSIEFVAGGRGHLTLNNKEYKLYPGVLFLYGPEINHNIHSSSDAPLDKYFVNFTGKKARAVVSESHLLGKILTTSSPNQILKTFLDIAKYGLSHSRHSDQICGTLVELLILQISDTALHSSNPGSPAFVTYQRCLNIINNRYRQLNSLSEITDICHVDDAYLCRLFKKFGSQSPYQYLTLLKMNRAADMLLESGSLIKEIAFEVGFSDQFHFSRTFKRIFDLSPTEFIRLHQGQ